MVRHDVVHLPGDALAFLQQGALTLVLLGLLGQFDPAAAAGAHVRPGQQRDGGQHRAHRGLRVDQERAGHRDQARGDREPRPAPDRHCVQAE
jgi:hypothetical protein